MKQTFKCLKCGRRYKKLTKEGLCCHCYLDTYKVWPKDFSDNNEKRKQIK